MLSESPTVQGVTHPSPVLITFYLVLAVSLPFLTFFSAHTCSPSGTFCPPIKPVTHLAHSQIPRPMQY